MAFLWRWFLIFSALVLAGGQLHAASARENRAYAVAVGAFQDGIYDRAETQFAQFVQTFPNSDRVAEAVLLEAQAEFKQGKLQEAINLLTDGKARAGKLADEYVYWIGEAQFKAGSYLPAAETFTSLARDYPDSSLRLRAVVEAASAFTASALAGSSGWSRVNDLLEEADGVFQRAVQLDADSELAARGKLLLAQARFEQKDFGGAARVLESLNPQTLPPGLDWQRAYLLCQARLAGGEYDKALAAATNLLQIAQLEKDDALSAESVALQASVLEKMNRTGEAIAAYQENLTNTAPAALQREAVLKIAELAIAQNQYSNAMPALEQFLAQYSNSPTADNALLALGELHLKLYVATRLQAPATNELMAAQSCFDQFVAGYTNNPLLGKAYLDRGWCNWLAEKIPESLADFSLAAQKLPPDSEDLAVAKFKEGDARFRLKDFSGARADYQSVLEDFTNLPAVSRALGEQALYQSLRANLDLRDYRGANTTLVKILKDYPEGDLSDNAILLVVETVDNSRRPEVARALLQQFERQFPDSELLSQARLAVARTYEQDKNWPAAITNYEAWFDNFPTNDLRAQASYSLAWANFQAGNETNAFELFTNFVAQYPTNALAPLAQWWVADHFFREGDFANAERNYKSVFQNTNWQGSPLAWQAQMMAGRAVVARTDYEAAIRDYFSKLEVDTNCPIDLRIQATFAHGDALMRSDSTDTNNPLANFQAATNVFSQICQLYPTNAWGALALFYIGECDVQMGSYDAATNAFTQVINSPAAGIAARSQAQIGIGIALEKKAALATGADQTALLKLARDNFLDVLDTSIGSHLRDGEVADDFWVKKAGLQVLPLLGQIGGSDPKSINAVIDRLEGLFPQAKESLEKKRAALLSAPN